MTQVEINGTTYDLKMTFKALKAFGIVKNDFENTTEKIGNIVMGIVGGDVFTLMEALTALSGKSEKEVQTDIEASEDLQPAFDAVENLLQSSPMTKKAVGMVIEPVKEAFKDIDKKMIAEVKKL
ncbi:tail assembly chaperone [Leuconostoc pseudomesenteroides]|uniref:tail assembly chaperone n=1 Tax=Leuconostoc pseudomesenteroides TaxID=33968 RepID=UPI0032DEC820